MLNRALEMLLRILSAVECNPEGYPPRLIELNNPSKLIDQIVDQLKA